MLLSWHPSNQPPRITFAEDQRWTRLVIQGTTKGNLLDITGTVDFVAHFEDASGPGSQAENSNFVRHEGRWVYVDGVHSP